MESFNYERGDHIEINHKMIGQLMRNWPKRSTVRGCYFDELKKQENYRPEISDYPTEMVPFWNHPNFQKVDGEIKEKVLTWGWLNYNQRTIHAEEKVANPAFHLLMQGIFPGCDTFEMKSVVQQSLIDEHFHSLMHYNAIEATRKVRNLNENIQFLDSITYRELVKAQNEVSESWKKQLMVLVWAIVSEISINAFLSLLSKSKTIQPLHSLIAKLHDVDEYAHSSVLIEIAKAIYVKMNREQQDFFVTYLPKALKAFVAQDYSVWTNILEHFKVKGIREIIEDSKSIKSNDSLVRDFSGLRKISEDLNIVNKINFEF